MSFKRGKCSTLLHAAMSSKNKRRENALLCARIWWSLYVLRAVFLKVGPRSIHCRVVVKAVNTADVELFLSESLSMIWNKK